MFNNNKYIDPLNTPKTAQKQLGLLKRTMQTRKVLQQDAHLKEFHYDLK